MAEPTDTTDPATTDDAKSDDGKGLRKQLTETLKQNAEYKTMLLSSAYTELGLDPTKELGKAIAKEYKGEPTLEALSAYAQDEYGYEAPAPSGDHTLAPVVAQQQARLDSVGATAGSIVPPTQSDALAKAEAEGDYATTLAIKGQQLAELIQLKS